MTICGARLALLAIALQLVLSFAHIHAWPAAPVAVSSEATPAGHAPQPGMPAAADDCAVCATVAAFASADLPQQMTLCLPVGGGERILPPAVRVSIAPGPYRLFRSRAPPIA